MTAEPRNATPSSLYASHSSAVCRTPSGGSLSQGIVKNAALRCHDALNSSSATSPAVSLPVCATVDKRHFVRGGLAVPFASLRQRRCSSPSDRDLARADVVPMHQAQRVRPKSRFRCFVSSERAADQRCNPRIWSNRAGVPPPMPTHERARSSTRDHVRSSVGLEQSCETGTAAAAEWAAAAVCVGCSVRPRREGRVSGRESGRSRWIPAPRESRPARRARPVLRSDGAGLVVSPEQVGPLVEASDRGLAS